MKTTMVARRPRAGTFEIATLAGARETRRGYVLGEWGTHKEPGRGVYFWSFTHLATGVRINVYPCHEVRASALGHLVRLDAEGPPAHVRALLDKYAGQWALGMTKVEA